MFVNKEIEKHLDKVGYFFAEHTCQAGQECNYAELVTKDNLSRYKEFNPEVEIGDIVDTRDEHYGDILNDIVNYADVKTALKWLANNIPYNFIFKFRASMSILEQNGLEDLIEDREYKWDDDEKKGWVEIGQFLKNLPSVFKKLSKED